MYAYDVRSAVNSHLKGLLIEIQYRTKFQHSWATAVEIIGHITENQPKFDRGDNKYKEHFALPSEIIARVYEKCEGPRKNLSNKELKKKFLDLEKETKILKTLREIKRKRSKIRVGKNFILNISKDGSLEVESFSPP